MAGEVIFVCGGVRSGKSSFGEKVAVSFSNKTDKTLHYIACGKAADEEMKERIGRHREDREKSPYSWTTWEIPKSISQAADHFCEKDIVLVDCLTTLAANEMFSEGDSFNQEAGDKVYQDIRKIACRAGVVILVSNDVFCEPISANEMVRSYVKTLGEIHQKITKLSKSAYSVNNGIATLKKGTGVLKS